MIDGPVPAVGITCIQIQTAQKQRPPCLGQNQTYIQAVIRAGAAPLLLPLLTDRTLLRALYERSDGLLFSGGEDVDPALYGEPLHEQCGPISHERDEMELVLARWAMDDGKPLLAICRGIQVLNVALGGSLYQDIGAQLPGAGRHPWYPDYPRNRLSHTVLVTTETRLADILTTTSLPVNSLHHQAIQEVAPGLAVVARAPDGVIEGVEAENHPFAIGVQWHPEDLAADEARHQRLFDILVEACRAQAARRGP
jgi:putative glutamine amidotransferase